MFGYLFILFTILPALELLILIKVGSVIGASNTILLIILTGATGAYFAKLQGFLIIQKIQNSMAKGEMPTDAMLDGLLVFCGGILLLTPGFITDILGFILLFPWTRALIKFLIGKKFQDSIYRQQTTVHRNQPNSRFRKNFEDAEFRE